MAPHLTRLGVGFFPRFNLTAAAGFDICSADSALQTWQKRLTALHVGQFPWEPAPAPQPMPGPISNPTVPSNVPRSGTGNSSSSTTENGASGQVRVKQEPNYDSQSFQTNGLPPNYGNNVARERAAQQLQQKFGADATLQINRLQAQSAMNMPAGQAPAQRSPVAGQYPQSNQMGEKQRADIAEYHRQAAQSQNPLRPPNPPQQPVVNNAGTDGADDWDSFVLERRQLAGDRHEADSTLRQQFEQMQRANEGGGLLLPASEQRKQPRLKKGEVPGPSQPSQFDGVDDDDEDSKADIKDDLFDDDDVDAINSDLDDPDDNAIEEEQDEGRPNQIMLCTYDKVQRVKNKWKCTLKDGVLNTGGKE